MFRKSILVLIATCCAAGISAAQPYQPAFDPAHLKGPRVGQPNQVMVLGTPHLSSLPPTFEPESLAALLDRLEAWRPQAIAIEALSGPQCDFLRRYAARYGDTAETYCWDPAPAQAATGLDVPAATAEADRLLADWPADPTPDQRRRLAAVFLAAGDQASALVQWLRLPLPERRAGNGLDAALVARLETLQTRRNENTLIAAPLAARLGLERVHPMDDHTAVIAIPDEAAFGAAMKRLWDNPATARRMALFEKLEAELTTGDSVLAMYRAHNTPEAARMAFDSDFGAALEDTAPQGFGRGYLSYWETRNLHMAARIRNVFAQRPGMRALVIVGASHKGYLEAYLNQMHDLHLVDANEVLR